MCAQRASHHLPEMQKAWLVADEMEKSKGSMTRYIHSNVDGHGWLSCWCMVGALVLLSLSSRQTDARPRMDAVTVKNTPKKTVDFDE